MSTVLHGRKPHLHTGPAAWSRACACMCVCYSVYCYYMRSTVYISLHCANPKWPLTLYQPLLMVRRGLNGVLWCPTLYKHIQGYIWLYPLLCVCRPRCKGCAYTHMCRVYVCILLGYCSFQHIINTINQVQEWDKGIKERPSEWQLKVSNCHLMVDRVGRKVLLYT